MSLAAKAEKRDQRVAQRHQAKVLAHWEHALEWRREPWNCDQTKVVGFFRDMNPLLSNHARTTFRYKGVQYRSSEHAYLIQQARCYGLDDLADTWTKAVGTYRIRDNRYAASNPRGWQSFDASNPKRVKAWSGIAFNKFRFACRGREREVRDRWEAQRLQVMFNVNQAKARQSAVFRAVLFATGNRYLVEVAPKDDFWGIGMTPSSAQLQAGPIVNVRAWGKNHLGLILMAIRNIQRQRFAGIKYTNRRAQLAKKVKQVRSLVSTNRQKEDDAKAELVTKFIYQLDKGYAAKANKYNSTAWRRTGGRIKRFVKNQGDPEDPSLASLMSTRTEFGKNMMKEENERRKLAGIPLAHF
jgi:ribA/ribD-fused uncharacterized protein